MSADLPMPPIIAEVSARDWSQRLAAERLLWPDGAPTTPAGDAFFESTTQPGSDAWASEPGPTTQGVSDPWPSDPKLVPGKDIAHWSGLPIWHEAAHARGYELPLPLGVTANAFAARHNFAVPRVTLGGAGGGLLDVGPLVRVKNADITETAWTARFDTWVFPFLNVYALAGYVDGRAVIELRPTLLPVAPAKFDIDLKFEGPTVGVGGTLAAGFKPIAGRDTIVFGLADLNVTRTFLDFNRVVAALDPVDVVVFSPRLGLRERILEHSPFGPVHASVWGGAMYQDVQELMTGRLSVLDVDFRANVSAVNPWSTIIGGRVELGENTVFTVEVGLGDRRSLMFECALRF